VSPRAKHAKRRAARQKNLRPKIKNQTAAENKKYSKEYYKKSVFLRAD
jgi:hypothetical protein